MTDEEPIPPTLRTNFHDEPPKPEPETDPMAAPYPQPYLDESCSSK